MLAASRAAFVAARTASVPRMALRQYSAHHGHEEHGEHGDHGHGEHGDHGHDHHVPLAESESIINSKTGIAAGIVASVVAYAYADSSYRASHDGASLVSSLAAPRVLSELQENYDSYRARVAKQQEIQEMMMFPSVEPRSYSNLITRVDSVPGRLFPTSSNTQLNTIQNHAELAPRKTKESPFY